MQAQAVVLQKSRVESLKAEGQIAEASRQETLLSKMSVSALTTLTHLLVSLCYTLEVDTKILTCKFATTFNASLPTSKSQGGDVSFSICPFLTDPLSDPLSATNPMCLGGLLNFALQPC